MASGSVGTLCLCRVTMAVVFNGVYHGTDVQIEEEPEEEPEEEEAAEEADEDDEISDDDDSVRRWPRVNITSGLFLLL